MTTANKKPWQAGNLRTASKQIDANHSTANDPLKGWFSLASNVKPSRNRQQKRGWQRGGRR
jgi:hypothetical protein